MRSWILSPSRALHLAMLMRVLGLVVVARSIKLAIMHIGYLDRTTLLFDYWGWGWLPKPGAPGAQALLACSALGGLGMLLGRGRVAAVGTWTALVTFGYVFLLDKAFFGSLNYAMVCMLSALVLTRAWRVDGGRALVTRIEALTPRLMLAIIYFYAGVIKLSPDWLRGDVIAAFFEASPPPDFMLAPAVLITLAILGAAFDLCVGPLLLLKKTRPFALVAAILFHLLNFIMLDVPEVALGMLAITAALFAPDHIHQKTLKIKEMDTYPGDTSSSRTLPNILRVALGAYLVWHVLFPLRPYVEQGDSRWTHHAQDFSWWLRSTHMSSDLKVFVQLDEADPVKVDVPAYIDVEHQKLFALDPALITQFAHHVASDYARKRPDVGTIHITVESHAQLNGRPAQRFVRQDVDLAAEPMRHDMSYLVVPLRP